MGAYARHPECASGPPTCFGEFADERLYVTIADRIRNAQENAGYSVSAILHELRTHKNPPTFHRTNRFTSGFQSIIDAYGMASYQEVNPGLFTIITFPFLFAIMFGDIGHGIIMFLSALSMIMVEKRFKKGTGNEIFDTFFSGRYIIVLMGVSSGEILRLLLAVVLI